MRLLITGGSSYLGSHILKRAPTNWKLAATYFTHIIQEPNVAAFRVDVHDADAVNRLFAEIQPDVTIHTPAVTSGDRLMPLNVHGSRNVYLSAAQANARLIHISSDVIFDGAHAPYDEGARPDPITPYAESKARGERVVTAVHPQAVIVRTSLIYGFNPVDPRTRQTLDGKMPRLFTDEFRCPIFVDDLADALLELALMEFVGVLNVAGPQRLSRYEFGLKLARAFGIAPQFEPAVTASSPTPPSTRLHARHFDRPENLADAVAECGPGPEPSHSVMLSAAKHLVIRLSNKTIHLLRMTIRFVLSKLLLYTPRVLGFDIPKCT